MVSSDDSMISPRAKRVKQDPDSPFLMEGGGLSESASAITLHIGTEKHRTSYLLHEALLRQSSEYFDRAFWNAAQKLRERPIWIKELSPRIFTFYTRFLLTGHLLRDQRIYEFNSDTSYVPIGPSGTQNFRLKHVGALLGLANFLQSSCFRDAIADAIMQTVSYWRKGHGMEAYGEWSTLIEDVYEHSAPDMRIRTLVVDLCLHDWQYRRKELLFNLGSYDSEFLRDYIAAAAPYTYSRKGEPASSIPDPIEFQDTCVYHEHTRRREPYCQAKQYRPAPCRKRLVEIE